MLELAVDDRRSRSVKIEIRQRVVAYEIVVTAEVPDGDVVPILPLREIAERTMRRTIRASRRRAPALPAKSGAVGER